MSKKNNKEKSSESELNIEADTTSVKPEGMMGGDKAAHSAVVDELYAEIDSLKKALAESEAKFVKLYANMENEKRHHKHDMEKTRKYALGAMGKDLIEVVDNLERTVDVAQGEGGNPLSLEGLSKGAHLTLSQFIKVLKKHGIEPIEAEGKPFDPDFHEAISTQAEAHVAPNTVLKLVQKGYLINGRLLRPARVIVSTK